MDYLKSKFYDIGKEWIETRDVDQISELDAPVGAINQFEIFLFDRTIITLLDVV